MAGTGTPRWTAVGRLRRRKGCGKIGDNGQQAGSCTYIYIHIYICRHTEHTHVWAADLKTRSCACVHTHREEEKKHWVCIYRKHMLLFPLCLWCLGQAEEQGTWEVTQWGEEHGKGKGEGKDTGEATQEQEEQEKGKDKGKGKGKGKAGKADKEPEKNKGTEKGPPAEKGQKQGKGKE